MYIFVRIISVIQLHALTQTLYVSICFLVPLHRPHPYAFLFLGLATQHSRQRTRAFFCCLTSPPITFLAIKFSFANQDPLRLCENSPRPSCAAKRCVTWYRGLCCTKSLWETPIGGSWKHCSNDETSAALGWSGGGSDGRWVSSHRFVPNIPLSLQFLST